MSKSLQDNRILVVDDHNNIRLTLRMTLEQEGATLEEAATVADAHVKLQCLKQQNCDFDLILLDLRLPDGNGLEILKMISAAGYASRVVMISGEGTVHEAFQATQMGAFDYVEKPFTPERILVSVRRCLDFNNLRIKALKGQEILGQAGSIRELQAVVARVAPTNGRVLIIGETGTGKELVARSIHRLSERVSKPLVKVNCAAIPHSLIESELFGHEKGAFTGATKQRRGLFEQADGGTLFLDEIGELSLDVQAKLLRVLETGELTRLGSETFHKVDVRVIAATHRDLPEMVGNQEFREDLFYRLNVVTVNVPALRERGDDIRLLAQHFLRESCEEHSVAKRTFSNTALEQLQQYAWPGNIRELKNVVERVAILADEEEISEIEDLKNKISSARPATTDRQVQTTATDQISGDCFSFASEILPWQEFHKLLDKSYIKFVLQKANGNVSEASRMLCLERAYLHRLMKKLGVSRDVVID